MTNLLNLKNGVEASNNPVKSEGSPRIKNNDIDRQFKKIKSRCQFQKNFSSFLLVIFFGLQYSVPVLLLTLGSMAGSPEQLTPVVLLLNPELKPNTEPDQEEIDRIIRRIMYLTGLVTMILGVINNIVRPSETYDRSAKYNNLFDNFEKTLELEYIQKVDEAKNDEKSQKILVMFLIAKNNQLCQLIQEYNEARSLSERTPQNLA